MAKFKIQVETKQLWEIETELENAEIAKEMRDRFYDFVQACMPSVQEKLQKFSLERTKIKLAEFFGGDDFSDSDIINLEVEELPEADRASLCGIYTLTLQCPHCGSEIQIDDSEGRYGDIMDAINDNKPAIITCDDCGKQFKQLSYKEY